MHGRNDEYGGGGMELEVDVKDRILKEYDQAVTPLMEFLPWLEQHSGRDSYTMYGSEGISEHSLGFPVYDANLMRFVKKAEKTSLMDRNYRYVFTRNRLQSHEAERVLIQQATWREWGQLKGIFSRYILEGKVKGRIWSEGVKEDIFYLVLLKMQEIVQTWGKRTEIAEV